MAEAEIYRLDDLVVDAGARRVRRGAQEIALPKLSFDLLLALVRSYPNAMSIDDLMSEVWGRTVVNPSTVAKRVQLLRDALGDDNAESRYVALIRGHGYRLKVRPVAQTEEDRLPETRPAAHAKWLKAFAAATVLVLAVTLFRPGNDEGPNEDPAPERSIAVLPFVSISGDADDELFAYGLTEELSHVLANLPQLKVTGRTSAFYYKDRNEDLRDVGRALGVAHILEGAVRRDGDQLRITAQLIETETGFHVWSQAYDRPLANLVEIQRDIAGSVAETLRGSFVTVMPPLQAGARVAPESHATYLRALQLSKAGRSTDAARAEALLEDLVREEPAYAAAWLLLAQVHAGRLLGNHEDYRYSWQESWDRIRAAVDHAVRLGVETGATKIAQGAIEWLYKRDTAAAATLFAEALALSPGDIDVVQGVARFARHTGYFDQALVLQRYLVDRDPLCAGCLFNLAKTYRYLRRYDEAVQTYRAFQRLAGGGEWSLGLALLQSGQAAAALESFRQLDHHLYLRLQGEAMALHDLGDTEAGEEALRRLEAEWGDQEPLFVAQAHAYLGRKDEAFDWLARLDRRGREDLRTDFADPLFDSLRSDPRWAAMLAGIGAGPTQLAEVRFAPDLSPFELTAGPPQSRPDT